jgi:hypothetical protein
MSARHKQFSWLVSSFLLPGVWQRKKRRYRLGNVIVVVSELAFGEHGMTGVVAAVDEA